MSPFKSHSNNKGALLKVTEFQYNNTEQKNITNFYLYSLVPTNGF